MSNFEAKTKRVSTVPIGELFLNRWSPRGLSGETLSDEDFLAVFEAARWAPSSYNNQPWRFIVAKRETPEWTTLFGLLGEFNQGWCKNASALIVVISSKNFEYNGKPSETHSFDAGAAWMSLALEATRRGLTTHGMQGFDYIKAQKDLQVPEGFAVEAMIALGKLGPKEVLSEELQKSEVVSDRKPLSDLIFKGSFGEKFL